MGAQGRAGQGRVRRGVLMRFSGLRPLEAFFWNGVDVENGAVAVAAIGAVFEVEGARSRDEEGDVVDDRSGIWNVRASAVRIEA